MMKKLYLPVLFLFPAMLLTAQNTTFKSRTKYSSGTLKPGFEFVTVNPYDNSKSGTSAKYATPPSLDRLLLKGGPRQVEKVIRKDGKPVYIERKADPAKSDPHDSPGEKLSGFLEETRIISGTVNPKEQFAVTQINEDRNGITHLKTIQV